MPELHAIWVLIVVFFIIGKIYKAKSPLSIIIVNNGANDHINQLKWFWKSSVNTL